MTTENNNRKNLKDFFSIISIDLGNNILKEFEIIRSENIKNLKNRLEKEVE
tara:strand:+ start:48 stop:200 length:153 start_codon:yes stop_codon:yes gene_type:complete